VGRLLLLCLLLCGCGARSKPPAVRLVFRHGGSLGSEPFFRSLFEEFEREHPGISVSSELLPANTDQQRQLNAVELQGSSSRFDVLDMDIVWVQEFARAGWLLDLSAYFDEKTRSGFVPSTLRSASFEGRYFSVPRSADAGLLYYRKDLLEKYGLAPPDTWDRLARDASEIVSKEKDPALTGFVWQGRQYEGLVCAAAEFLGSNGVRFLDERGRWAADDSKAARALGFMRDLIGPGRPSPESVLTADEETARLIFGNGQAVFMRNWPYAWGLFAEPGQPMKGKVAVALLPRFPGGKSVSTLGGWYLGVNHRSSHPKEAYEFIQFMTSRRAQTALFLRLSYLPTRKDLYLDPGLLARAPQLAEFERALDRAVPRPETPAYAGLSLLLQSEFSRALVGRCSPEAALRRIRRRAGSLLNPGGA
jgi:multiple sugar transport system substrate-binding protein